MKRGWQIVLIVAALTVATGVLSPAVAGEEPLARVSAGTASVEWLAAGGYERLILTVSSPDGTVLRREFGAGETPSFSLFDAQGAPRPDGSYTWELQAVPKVPKWVKDRIAAAREAGDDAALEALRKAGRLPQGKVQAGVFSVAGGSVVAQGMAEPPARSQTRKVTSNSGLTPTTEADQVIPDDLIVQGSLCVGFDCVNNESFGFDTIRLKENNTRIKFEDTSTGTFPTNDWQLTANDSASGGASKFSIEDITGAKVPFTITAGASTNSIFVDSTGRVGFRTSTPVLDLHVATSNTPAIRLEQNNSGGFTAQTWDIGANEANFFVRDVTGGSRLPFRIRPGAPTSSIDISADGDVGIGTASPDVRLDVTGAAAGAEVVRIQNTDAAGFSGINVLDDASLNVFFIGHDNTGNANRLNSISSRPLLLMTESVERVRVDSEGDVGINCNNPTSDLVIASGGGCSNPSSSISAGGTQFVAASSRTFKTNLSPVKVPGILEKIASIDVFNYDFIQGPKDRIGLIAEDFHKVFGRGSDKYIDGGEVQMALWLAVQELAAQNKELMKRLGTMEAQLTALQGKAPELFAAVKATLAAQEETAP